MDFYEWLIEVEVERLSPGDYPQEIKRSRLNDAHPDFESVMASFQDFKSDKIWSMDVTIQDQNRVETYNYKLFATSLSRAKEQVILDHYSEPHTNVIAIEGWEEND